MRSILDCLHWLELSPTRAPGLLWRSAPLRRLVLASLLGMVAACSKSNTTAPEAPQLTRNASVLFYTREELRLMETKPGGDTRTLFSVDERYPFISTLALSPAGDFVMAFLLGRMAGIRCDPGDGRALRFDLNTGRQTVIAPDFFEFRFEFDSYISNDLGRLWIVADREPAACPQASDFFSLALDGSRPPLRFTDVRDFANTQVIGPNNTRLSSKQRYISFVRSAKDLYLVQPDRPETEVAVDLAPDQTGARLIVLSGFSPDERHLLYRRRTDLRIADTGTGRFRAIAVLPEDPDADDLASLTLQAFSEVDNRFVYVEEFFEAGVKRAPRLVLADADNPRERLVLNETLTDDSPAGEIERPMMSADGRWVVYEADLAGKGNGIWRVSAETPGASMRLSAPSQTDVKLIAVSSQADHVVYEVPDSGLWINTLAEPGMPQQIAQLPEAMGVRSQALKFSPDHRQMMFLVDLREDVVALPDEFPPNQLVIYEFGSEQPARVLYDSPEERVNVREFFFLPAIRATAE